MTSKTPIVVLISGRGSNLQALIDACAKPDFPAAIAKVISNIPNVQGLERAQAAGIPTAVVPHKDYADRESFEDALYETIAEAKPEFVCLAGFMRILTSGFVNRWRDRIINIHPSLLPAFKGLHTHERVLEAGVRFTGCTVHFVRPETDAGPIIIQAVVPVRADDDAGSLSKRVLDMEHVIYPEAVRLAALGLLWVKGHHVEIDGQHNAMLSLVNPLPPHHKK